MPGLKARAKTLEQLADNALFYVRPRPLPVDEKAAKLLDPGGARPSRGAGGPAGRSRLDGRRRWKRRSRSFAEAEGLKLGQIAQPLRAALTGSTVSPGVFEVMTVLGKAEVLGRLADAAAPPVS